MIVHDRPSRRRTRYAAALLIVCAAFLALPPPADAQERPQETSLFEIPFEKLMDMRVVSASRSLTRIAEAPSVVSVITAEDISRQGLKTLEEVLQRVPGFFPSEAGTRAIVGNRGILTNNFLLLIDGHSVNSIVKNGFFQQHIYPLLDSIERIEVIRGPGSTLWGSDAALGVINIITRNDWEDVASPHGTVTANFDYADNIRRHIAKFSYARRLGEQNGFMLTGNWFASEPDWLSRFSAGGRLKDSFIVRRGNPVVLRDFEGNSWEMAGKLRLGSFQLSARGTRFVSMAPFLTNTGLPERRGHFDYRNHFVEATYNSEIGNASDIVLRVFADSIRDHAIGDVGGGIPTRYIRSDQDGFGAELIFSTNRYHDHAIKLGARYGYTNVRRLDERNYFEGELVGATELAKSGIDTTLAVFAEDTWRIADKWIAVFGGRLDYNDFREGRTIFLPRFGLIWSASGPVTLKYLYNTGYIRPFVEQSHGTAGAPFWNDVNKAFWVGAGKSQRISSHDIQLLFNYENTYLGATFYYLTYENFIEWPGIFYRRDPDYRATFQNLDDVTSRGVELDFRMEVSAPLTIYGNYSYAHARFGSMIVTLPVGVTIDLTGKRFVEPGGAMTGAPEHIWNFGVDYEVADGVELNLHNRGWTGAWVLETRLPKYRKFGPEYYVDLNLRWKNILNGPLGLSLYCKDLFDNTGSTPPSVPSGPPVAVTGSTFGQATPSGVLPGFGRTIGLKLGFTL